MSPQQPAMPARLRATPKGRQVDPRAREEVAELLGDAPRRRDLLIEHLHRIQDRYGCLSAPHLVALAAEMGLAMTEVYEVATFYHHFDVVKEVLAREGEIGFWTVRMRPGKPLAFGSFTVRGAGAERRVPHLGLPGNPVSAMMTFELFGRAVLYTMLGRDDWERPRVRATAAERIDNPDGRRVYARAVIARDGGKGRYVARLTGPQGSGVLTSMALANGYAVCPEDRPAVEPGEECEVLLVGPVEGPAD